MKKVLLTLLITACVSVNFAYSQDNKSETTEKKGEIVAPSKEMQTLILAGQLAKYGYENNSATALIQAAEFYLSVPTQELKPESFEQGKGEETTKDEFVSHDPKKILADAKELAAGDAVTLAVIEKLEKSSAGTSRGAVGGPKRTVDKVKAHSTDTYVIRFYAHERATVAISGDGDTDLDLYVYDESGNLIDKDDDYSDDCVVNFYPRWTGRFTIKIVNRGNVYNRYVIATN
jgi:hypothetical protein